MTWLKKFPFENILLDVVLTILAFLLPDAVGFLTENLSIAIWFVAPLQLLALVCAFQGRAAGLDELRESKIRDGLKGFYTLNLILALGGFLWFFLIAAAVETQTGGYPYWAFRFAFFTVLFGGILAYGISLGNERDATRFLSVRLTTALVVFVYLYFTETLLQAAAAINHLPFFMIALVTLISYLPVRLALAFRPPFSYWDFFSALAFFGVFLYTIY
jgi:hypothetical protein